MAENNPTSLRIEDYALIGNCASAALVGRNGSIDWLCFPRFDSSACFAALLGNADSGFWRIAPQNPPDASSSNRRSYRPRTLILETEFETPSGRCVLVDCMDRDGEACQLLRLVRGISGSVDLHLEIKIRFEYGSVVPWVTRMDDGRLRAVAGPDQLVFCTSLPPDSLRGEDMSTLADFTVAAGEEIAFSLVWNQSFRAVAKSPDVAACIERLDEIWRKWSDQHVPQGPHHEAVLRSLITLKALTHFETNGIVAAPTTSLPERIGGSRNWDYRYCWLRDATFTLSALMNSGFTHEASAWRDWLLRAVAGSPAEMQIMYGLAGERRLNEFEIPWLSGYEQSKPVRIGNAASQQFQLDVFGEVVSNLFEARNAGLVPPDNNWNVERGLLEHLGDVWNQPDAGIWEMRGPARNFTYSKAMAWVAVDRGIRAAERFGVPGDLDPWRKLRADIHADVCAHGFNTEMNSFVQFYGAKTLDASLLLLPIFGFLPSDDLRIQGTIAAIEKHLLKDGFVSRYNTADSSDGVGGDEGAFLACSFWLVENYVMQGRQHDAENLFQRLLSIRNDLGLLAEEYDPVSKRQVGNFPQAFSHVALINSAHALFGFDAKSPTAS